MSMQSLAAILPGLMRELVRRVNDHLGAEIVREVRFTLARGGIQR